MFELSINKADRSIGRARYTGDAVRIGRGADNDLQVDAADIALVHAAIELRDGMHFLRDLGSVIGTFVNGQRVNGVRPLSDADKIDLGKYTVFFHASSSTAAVDAPQSTKRQKLVVDGDTISFPIEHVEEEEAEEVRPSTTSTKTFGSGLRRPPVPKGGLWLADVLRELHAERPIPVASPVLVTSLAFGPRDLALCVVYSLGTAAARAGTPDVRLYVGRGDEADFVVKDATVSKRHAAFIKKEGRWWVDDAGSSNGTHVGDRFLTPGTPVRVSTASPRVQLGPTITLNYLDGADLLTHFAKALGAWKRAFARGGTARSDKGPLLGDDSPLPDPKMKTKRVQRPELPGTDSSQL